VLSTVASDAHTWNLLYLQLLLEEHGFHVRNLGPCVPVDDVVRACLADRPRILVFSTVNGHGLIEAPEYIRAIRENARLRGLAVVIGGKLRIDGSPTHADVLRLRRLGFDGVFTTADAERRFRRFLQGLLQGIVTAAAG
jgi:methylmalonyl-CoA mutase cobalamin-binding subunit